MKTKRILFLVCATALSLITTVTSAAASSPMRTQSATARPAPHFTSRTMTGTHHFRHFRNRRFVFIDAFGLPVFSPYSYYYYPDDYYGYSDNGSSYSNVQLVIEVQRRLARAGYYHGRIEGILGPQTLRAISAYERDHSRPAYGLIDRQLLRTLDFG